MSDKEYEIEFDGDRAIIREKKEYQPTPGKTNPNPSARERLGKKMRTMSKPEKSKFCHTKPILILLDNSKTGHGKHRDLFYCIQFSFPLQQ